MYNVRHFVRRSHTTRRFCSSNVAPKTDFYKNVGLVATILGTIIALDAKSDAKIESLNAKTDVKIESLRSELGSKIDKSVAKIESLNAKTDAKIESLNAKTDAKIESLRSELLTAFSNAQGERIRALEVLVATRGEKEKN